MTKLTKICTNLSSMLEEDPPLLSYRFEVGEIYLFHCCDPLCPPDTSLWGVFDKQDRENVYLESSSFDLYSFTMWHPLPTKFNYCRLASRSELRDYVAALCSKESGNM